MNLKNLKNRAGFTLIELIVVIAIMAILAGVAVPVYSGYIEKAEKAADLQLLGAVNSAFGAACIENDTDVHSVEKDVGKPSITNYEDVAVSLFDDEFQVYFAGNEGGFKRIKQLLFVNGAFVDPTSGVPEGVISVSYGGATIYMSEQDIQNLKDSTFLNATTLGSDKLLEQVDYVTGIATDMAGKLDTVYNDPDFVKTAMAVLGVTTEDEYKAKVAAMAKSMYNNGDSVYASETEALEQIQANAAVLYAADSATKFTDSDINKLFSDTGIDEIKKNLTTTGSTTTGMAQAALVYGMYTSYAHSTEYGDATKQSNTQDAVAVLDALENDAKFKEYIKSDVGQADLDAYMSSLGIITDSAKSDPAAVEHLITNGFANSELKDVVANLTK